MTTRKPSQGRTTNKGSSDTGQGVQVAQGAVQELPDPIAEVLALVAAELKRQDEKWGEQNHPIVGGATPIVNRRFAASQEKFWKDMNDRRVERGQLGWDGILYEEVFEAFAARDPREIETELIQSAAVAVQAVLSQRRQADREVSP